MIEIAPMITLPDFSVRLTPFNLVLFYWNMKPMFLWKLQQCRTEAQVKFIITSGSRCEQHNKDEGGKERSEHLTGEAADIYTENSHIRFKILQAAFRIGFTRIGIGPTYIHLGNKHVAPQEVAWDYYPE